MFVVILAQSAATSRAYAGKYEEAFSEDTDLVGLGAANVAAAFSGTFVVNGSPTKTQMVDSAGGRSQLAQLTTAAVVLLVLLLLTGPLAYLPNAALAAVVFLIAVELIDVARDAAHPGLPAPRVRHCPAHGRRGRGPGGRGRHRACRRRLGHRPPAPQLPPAQQRAGEVTGRALAACPGPARRADRGRTGGLPVRHQPLLRQRLPPHRRRHGPGRAGRPAAVDGSRRRGHRRRRLHRGRGPHPRHRTPPQTAHPLRRQQPSSARCASSSTATASAPPSAPAPTTTPPARHSRPSTPRKRPSASKQRTQASRAPGTIPTAALPVTSSAPQHGHRRARRHCQAQFPSEKPAVACTWMIPAVLASLADGVITRGYSCSSCLADRILAYRGQFRAISRAGTSHTATSNRTRAHLVRCAALTVPHPITSS